MAGYGIEEATVGASRTKHRRTRNRLHVKLHTCGLLAEEPFFKYLRVELVHIAYELLAHALYAGGLHLLLHKAVELLYDVELIDLLCKASYQLDGKGIGKPQLKKRRILRESVLCVLIRYGGGHNAYFAALHFCYIKRAITCVLLKLLHVFFQLRPVCVCVGGGGYELAHVARIFLCFVLLPFAEGHDAL